MSPLHDYELQARPHKVEIIRIQKAERDATTIPVHYCTVGCKERFDPFGNVEAEEENLRE